MGLRISWPGLHGADYVTGRVRARLFSLIHIQQRVDTMKAYSFEDMRRGLMRRGSWSPNASPAVGAGELLGWPPVRA